jgi:hypothetical protein
MPSVSKSQQRLFNAKCKKGDKAFCKLAEEFNVSGKAFSALPERKKKPSKRKKGTTRG